MPRTAAVSGNFSAHSTPEKIEAKFKITMLGFLTLPCQWKSSPSLQFLSSASSPSSGSTRSPFNLPLYKFTLHYSLFRSKSQIHRNHTRFTAFSSNNGNGLGGNIKNQRGGGETNGAKGSNGGGDDDLKKERGPIFNIKWAELLIDPDPDNILAVALTGLLAWASVQVLWQLFFISLAILVAALKYSFIAALLLFILITLL